jgi:hypothetical protein
MTLANYLLSRGLSQKVIDELLPLIPEVSDAGIFRDAASITAPDRWFYWPEQTCFIAVGQCPNGDAVAIDTHGHSGAVFYVAHELIGRAHKLEDIVVRVADSPAEFARRFLEEDEFPDDYWDAKTKRTEPSASPDGGPAQRFGNSAVGGGPPSVS